MRETELLRAVELLRAGELVAFPTETVYGLGADAGNPVALAKIFAAKGRPADHPLIVHIADISHLGQWAREIPDAAHLLAKAFWPGPLTLILKRQPNVPDLVTGGQDTVGLRIPNHPLALQLLTMFNGAGGSGLAAPSANRFGRISPTSAQHVRDELGAAVALVLDGGPCTVGIESTIVDLSRDEPVILRPGIISAEQIAQALHRSFPLAPGGRGCHEAAGEGITVRPEQNRHSRAGGNPATSAPRAPGSLAAHYAPATPMRLVPAATLAAEVERCMHAGRRIAVLSVHPFAAHERLLWRQASSAAGQYAHDLYLNLRTLDQAGVDLILVEAPPQGSEWTAVNDRLGRAAFGSSGQ
ncbi:Threonylcarbamoyl-AMP synthase [Georgfuchsia toluolica]|uniref:Threonylcarbamoyl-AMP synthase n=1 Tax=Georgfuchsia toluolica TaxID=424218 RepID=A0A916J6Z8_9PROT|nr:L-threonylcarbamoyladenylate synthase [Georgfuchsia toluolica]CAG4884593.1 Threonylcarbamoyl-AMP synthase [Georgfuchsia toluolica]